MQGRSGRLIAVAVLAAVVAVGCGAKQPGGGGTEVTPAQQCQIVQSFAAAAETGLLLAKVKDATARAALYALLDGVHAGAADFCAAVTRGDQDAVASVLVTFNEALASFNRQLRAAQEAELARGRSLSSKAPAAIPLGGGGEALAGARACSAAGLAGGALDG